MNLDNCAFLGDYEDTYTLRLLDGSLMEMRINMINDADIPGVIIDTAANSGVVLRRHRLHYSVDPENPRLYLAYQDAPSRANFCDGGINDLNIGSTKDLIDAVDFFEALDPKSLDPELDFTHDRSTLKIQYSTNTNQDKITMFRRLIQLAMQSFDYNHLDIDNPLGMEVCKANPNLTKLTVRNVNRVEFIYALQDTHITELCLPSEERAHVWRDFIKKEWGAFLAEKTNVQTIRLSVRSVFAAEIPTAQQSVALHLHFIWPHWKVTCDRTDEVEHFLYGLYYQVWFKLQRGFTLNSEWGVLLEDEE